MPADTTLQLLSLRMASVLAGCASALVVNVSVTGLSYQRVFTRRAARLAASVDAVAPSHPRVLVFAAAHHLFDEFAPTTTEAPDGH